MKRTIFFMLLWLNCLSLTAQFNINVDSLKQILFQRDLPDTVKVQTFSQLSNGYFLLKADSGIYYAQQALSLAKKINYKRGEGIALGYYGWSLWSLSVYDKAAEAGLQAQNIFEELNEKQWIHFMNLLIANVYRDMGSYSTALYYVSLALQADVRSAPVNAVTIDETTYAIAGSIYLKKNQLDSASYYIDKAYEQDKNFNRSKWNWIIELKGDLEKKRNNFQSALQYYRSSVALALENKYPKDILDTYNSIAEIYQQQNQIDSSIYYTKEVLNNWQFTSYQKGVLDAYTILAEDYKLKNQNDSAIKYLEKSISLKNDLFNQQKAFAIQQLMFNETLQKQQLETARLKYQTAIKFYAVVAVLIMIAIIAFMLFRNNRHKQKANLLLQQEKQKVESTLTELKSTQSQLIQSEKMASLGELTAGVAHEIQNPLNFVNNFSEVNIELTNEMNDENDVDELKAIANDIKQNSEKILLHGKRADAIVKNMLQHSRKNSGQKEPTDVNALCDEYIRLSFHGMRAKDKSFNADFKTDFDETIGKINIIPQDIGRVLLNLFNNAFYAVNEKFTATRSPLTADYKPTVSIQTKKINNKVEILVSDNGNGIPQNIIDKIFQPFFTTKPTGQGTGLGLSLSYDIIKAHGGEIKVESKEGESITFLIQLPII